MTDAVTRSAYRGMRRLASVCDRTPVLKALVERNGLVKLPPALDEAVAAFLGSSRRFFWPAPQSISAAVRSAFKRPMQPSDSMPLETAMGGLRYLAMLVATADAIGITGSGKGSEPPRPAQPNTRSFATRAASSPDAPGSYQRSNLPPNGPQLLSAPEAGAFLVSHPLQDGPLSRSVVLLCSHSLFQGTHGLVINKLMDSQHHPGGTIAMTEPIAAVLVDVDSAGLAGVDQQGHDDATDAQLVMWCSTPAHTPPARSGQPEMAGPRAGHSEATAGTRMLPGASARAKAGVKRAEQKRELGDHHTEGDSTSDRGAEDAAASSLRGAMSMRRRAADQQRARSIRRAVRRAVQQQRTAAARMAAQLAGVVGGRATVWDGGPVNNLGQVLHRCPALGGQEVVPAAQGSSPADGPLLVGGDMDRLSDVKVRQCIQPSGATVFHGECEWYPGQLEEELVTGAWQVVRWPALLASLTGPDLRARHEAWQTVLHALGGEYRELASIPPKLVSDLAEMSV